MSFFIHRTKIKDESERLRLYCYTLSIVALEDNIIISYGNHVIFLDLIALVVIMDFMISSVS